MKRIVAACALFCLAVSGRAQTEYPFPVFQTDGLSLYTLNGEDISGADMHVTSTPELIVEMPTTMDEATVLDLTTPRLLWADDGGRVNDTVGAYWDATNAGIAVGSATAATLDVLGTPIGARIVAQTQDEGAIHAAVVSHLGGYDANGTAFGAFTPAFYEGTWASKTAASSGTYYPMVMPVFWGTTTTTGYKLNTMGLWAIPETDGMLTYNATVAIGPILTGLRVQSDGDAFANTLTVDGSSGTTLDVDANANVDGGLVVDGDVDFGGGDFQLTASTGRVELSEHLAVAGRIGVGPGGIGSYGYLQSGNSDERMQLWSGGESGLAALQVFNLALDRNFFWALFGKTAAGTLAGVNRAGNGFLTAYVTDSLVIGTENAADLKFSVGSVVNAYLSSGGGWNVGTATDASGQGDLAAGLTGAARVHYDQSDHDLDGYDSGGALSWKIDATAGGATVFNEDSDDIDFRIETNSEANAVVVDAAQNFVTVNSWFGTGAGASATIATGAVTATRSRMIVDTEGAAATDDLDTINVTGGAIGDVLVVSTANSARTVVAKDGTSNLHLAGDFSMDNAEDRLVLMRESITEWYELSRSDNGA